MAKEKITGAEALMRSLEHEGVTTLSGRSYHAGI
jgi:acetolactate synthase-1/2/3 large subunit